MLINSRSVHMFRRKQCDNLCLFLQISPQLFSTSKDKLYYFYLNAPNRRLFFVLFFRKLRRSEAGAHAFDDGQNLLPALPRFGGGRYDVPFPRFEACRDAAHALPDAHARELVRLGRHDGEGRLRGV